MSPYLVVALAVLVVVVVAALGIALVRGGADEPLPRPFHDERSSIDRFRRIAANPRTGPSGSSDQTGALQ